MPTTYFENLADFAERHGSTRERLFRRARIDARRIRTQEVVRFSEFRQLLLATEAEAGTPSFALELGCALSPASHGALGLALLASQSLKEGVDILVRYVRTRTPLVRVAAEKRDGRMILRLFDGIVLGDVQRPVHELVISTLVTALRALTGDRFRASEVRFAFGAPSYVPLVERLLVAKTRFDARHTEIRFPIELLDLGVTMADRTAARLAIEKLEAELGAIEGRVDLRDRVRERLLRERGVLPDCERVASDLGTTARTLRRHLAALGTSYQSILEETRRELALHYLRDTDLGVASIAEMLGYSDPSNFGAAFRRWTGKSPRSFRKRT